MVKYRSKRKSIVEVYTLPGFKRLVGREAHRVIVSAELTLSLLLSRQLELLMTFSRLLDGRFSELLLDAAKTSFFVPAT